MKTPSLNLFTLIKSMNTQEKVQFKLYASRKKAANNYLKLFDAIDAQIEYNEPALKQKFKKEAFITNLDSAKTYLIESILKSLQEYYSSDSAEGLLCNYIQQIEILINKRLLQLAGKIINKAEALARKHHCHAFLLIILSWKRKTMVTGIKMKEYERFYNELYTTELQTLEECRNVIEYQKLFIKVLGFSIEKAENNDKKIIDELNKIIRNPWLKDETMANSYLAKVLYNRILGDVFSLLKEWEKSYFYYKKAIDYFEFVTLGNNDKMNIYSRAMISLHYIKKDGELQSLKNEAASFMKSLPDKLKSAALSKQYQSLIHNYIHYQLAVGKIDEAHLQSEEIKGLVEKDPSVQGFVVYYGNASLIAFYMGDYRKALSCINKILTMEKKGVREDIILATKKVALVVHYELGNEELMPNLCKSYIPYFNMHKQQNKVGKILLDFFGKTIHKTPKEKGGDTTQQNRTKLFTILKKELEPYKTENIFTQFDFISWCDSKIQNRPMIDIVREKSDLSNSKA